MTQDYLIAGHRVRIEGKELTKAMDALPGFDAFKTDSRDVPLCRFVAAGTPAPAFESISYTSEANGFLSHIGRYDGGYLFDTAYAGNAAFVLWTNKPGDTTYFSGNFEPALLSLGCWIAYGLATLHLQTLAIHASAIRYKDKAALFLGESGTGKSTHTRLWCEHIKEATLLNDDSPIIRIVEGKPWVYGSPWSGKTPCYKSECYPLAGSIRLSQAPYNEIQQLRTVQAFAALHPSCPPFFAYDDALYDHVGQTLGLLLPEAPTCRLACLPDADAARLSFNTLFGTCEK